MWASDKTNGAAPETLKDVIDNSSFYQNPDDKSNVLTCGTFDCVLRPTVDFNARNAFIWFTEIRKTYLK